MCCCLLLFVVVCGVVWCFGFFFVVCCLLFVVCCLVGCQRGARANGGHSWTWVGNCANPMRIAANRGVGGTTGKSGNVQLRVFKSQIRIRGAGRRSVLICSKQAPGLRLDSLSERPSEYHQHLHAAVRVGLPCICEADKS